MTGKKNHPAFRKFLGIIAGILFVSAMIFGVYKVADAVLDGTLVLPNLTASSSASVAAESVVSSRTESAALSVPQQSSMVSSGPAQSQNQSQKVEGIFSSYSTSAVRKLKTMTLREKVGQVFIFRCPVSGAVQTAADYQPAGYCLMADNFQGKTTAQVKSMTASYQNVSKTHMALCCDEEGGTVVRASKFKALAKTPFRSPQDVFKLGKMTGITNDTVQKAQFLKSLGLNMNLAPVCDVSVNPANYIYARSFGKDAQQTSTFVKTSVQVYNSQKMSCTLKHFPGYGNNADTHTGIAYDSRSYNTFVSSDFLPFQAGIQAGAPCILVSHNIVNSMDSKYPASLSAKVHDILRTKLGFTGIIMTDDLVMGAIRNFTGGQNPSVLAFNAGNDILLSSNIQEDFNALYSAVKSGAVSEDRLNESVLRILAWKYKMGII